MGSSLPIFIDKGIDMKRIAMILLTSLALCISVTGMAADSYSSKGPVVGVDHSNVHLLISGVDKDYVFKYDLNTSTHSKLALSDGEGNFSIEVRQKDKESYIVSYNFVRHIVAEKKDGQVTSLHSYSGEVIVTPNKPLRAVDGSGFQLNFALTEFQEK